MTLRNDRCLEFAYFKVWPTNITFQKINVFPLSSGKVVTYILIYIPQDATSHSLFYVEAALHVSGSTSTHNQERIQLNLQHLVFVTPLLLPAAIVEELKRFDKYQML
jgi:hypothetical protein